MSDSSIWILLTKILKWSCSSRRDYKAIKIAPKPRHPAQWLVPVHIKGSLSHAEFWRYLTILTLCRIWHCWPQSSSATSATHTGTHSLLGRGQVFMSRSEWVHVKNRCFSDALWQTGGFSGGATSRAATKMSSTCFSQTWTSDDENTEFTWFNTVNRIVVYCRSAGFWWRFTVTCFIVLCGLAFYNYYLSDLTL